MKLRMTMAAAGLLGLAIQAQAAPLPTGWTTNGNAGTSAVADGDVTLAPGFSSYVWLSTHQSQSGNGGLPSVGGTNGTTVQSAAFNAAAGDKLNFYFDYITSDGSGYSDYAWAGLFDSSNTLVTYLFTARTTPSGDTVPGFDLPGLGAGVTLSPASTPINAGASHFSPLGASSDGACYDVGCGSTGWIQMNYNIAAAGTYTLKFGVSNWSDTDYDSAFAIAGVAINDKPIDPDPTVPEPASLALAGLALAGLAVTRRRRV